MTDTLGKIIAKKKQRVEEARKIFPRDRLESLLAHALPVRDALSSLLANQNGTIPVIAEIKRKSPTQGEIMPGLSPAQLAKDYESAGARAISVLCEQDFFGGSLEDMEAAKQSCSLPVLCKDFVISTFQVLTARIHGADLILLIASALDQRKLNELFILVKEMGMTPLIETHDQAELERALSLGAKLIGINNRNLATLETSIDTTRKLLPLVPKDKIVVSESGFSQREELVDLRAEGVSAFLIGGSILSSQNPGQKLKELVHG
jgi:indole-3-glycerol phosphate synthase